MSDIIKLLPDHIANQIAAGEVVQRPASVVKELVENSIDSGATKINLIVKDGGRTLVQVIDNGSGMTAIDARMSFERHATSKITSADDLFKLQTKGFRGEALASVAAIAHVCMKTKLHDAELGTEINIEGSKIISQEPVACSNGTSIAVKNLFFNVPARRNFLGKDTTEYHKVVEEFLRIALVHFDIEFSFHHNSDEIYFLPTAKSLRQRIVNIYGAKFNEKLVPVNEETDIVRISGFVTKPDKERATADRCFFFVNNRYFKDRYFNHAVMTAYEGLIPSGKYPPYFLYLDVPTESIDVNVHPTKTEIKFEENQSIYSILRSAVKLALGKNNITSSIDFEPENSFNVPSLKKGEEVKMPEIKVDPNFNPFQPTTKSRPDNAVHAQGFGKLKPVASTNWGDFYGDAKQKEEEIEIEQAEIMAAGFESDLETERKKPIQINDKYILTSVKAGFLLIDQYRAHVRILYDRLIEKMSRKAAKSQQLLFPEELEIDIAEKIIWNQLLPTLVAIGFELELSDEVLKIVAVPMELGEKNPQQVLASLMDEFKQTNQDNIDLTEVVVSSVAARMAIKGGTKLSTGELEFIVDALFASSSPYISPQGKKIIESFSMDEITKRFN